MFTKYSVLRLFVALFIILMISSTASASPLKAPNGTGFTYQGKLIDGGSPANGAYDLQFKLYDALTGGAQVGGTLTQSSVPVTNGLFTVQLDFGNVFNGTALYLEIGVAAGGSGGPYTALIPRQPLSPTPYALYSTQAGNATQLNTQPASYYLNASNINIGTLGTNFFSAYADLVAEGYLGNAASDLALNNGTLQSTLNADLLDGLHAISFSLTGHTHWGQTWTGTGTGLTLSGGTIGLSGSGSTYGVSGTGNTGVSGSGTSIGVYGSSSNYGVYGDGSIGVRGSGTTYGVYGQVDLTAGSGVRGYASATSGTTYGVYGTSNSDSNDSAGIYGHAFSGSGVYGKSDLFTGVYGSGVLDGVEGYVTEPGGVGVHGSAYNGTGCCAGIFDGSVIVNGTVDIYGALYVHGSPKSAVVKTQDYGTRTLYAVESPENWFQDFGTGQLMDGKAVITIDPVYAETVNLADDYHVFFTPMGDCSLYVTDKTPTSFTVKALGGQTCSIAFDYNIVAKRLGYETVRLAVYDTSPAEGTPKK